MLFRRKLNRDEPIGHYLLQFDAIQIVGAQNAITDNAKRYRMV